MADGVELRLVAAPHIKIGAQLLPIVELQDGPVVRMSGTDLTPDSAYFAAPPAVVVPTRARVLHGVVRASACRSEELLCRAFVVPF